MPHLVNIRLTISRQLCSSFRRLCDTFTLDASACNTGLRQLLEGGRPAAQRCLTIDHRAAEWIVVVYEAAFPLETTWMIVKERLVGLLLHFFHMISAIHLFDKTVTYVVDSFLTKLKHFLFHQRTLVFFLIIVLPIIVFVATISRVLRQNLLELRPILRRSWLRILFFILVVLQLGTRR